jgi:riboflavin biosynthesis pyrimidine reductase
VISGRLDLDVESRFFTEAADPPVKPIVITGAGSPIDRREALAAVADVIVTGDAHVDLPAALAVLGRRGAATVLCEGGPTLNDQLLGAGLIDELCLTMAPWLVGGDSRRVVSGPALPGASALRLARVIEDDGVLLLRYLARR